MTEIGAREYATNLLVSFVNEHCSPVPGWKPLPDLLGVLTQLDNAITIARDYKAEIERLRAALAEIDALDDRPAVSASGLFMRALLIARRALEPEP